MSANDPKRTNQRGARRERFAAAAIMKVAITLMFLFDQWGLAISAQKAQTQLSTGN
jgi:hypothetical protein